MKLRHTTHRSNLESIFTYGLIPGEVGCIYLSPLPRGWTNGPLFGEALLEVETEDLPLTAFEDCADWEVLCWTKDPIPPCNIRVISIGLE